MDADRFDQLARALTDGATRRRIARTLGGLSLTAMLGPLLGLVDVEAKKKKGKHKKKKKCKGTTKKCGKKCIPSTNCCTAADCDDDESCEGGACVRPPFCTGFDYCGASGPVHCEQDGAEDVCLCWVTSDGAPFCALEPVRLADSCDLCFQSETCLNTTDCTGNSVACGKPCAEPR